MPPRYAGAWTHSNSARKGLRNDRPAPLLPTAPPALWCRPATESEWRRWPSSGHAAERWRACAGRGCCAGSIARPIARDLLLAPPDLRPQDPCFAEEVESGSFGLCGQTVDLDGASPFTVRPPSQAWARELHAFGWLRHFSAGWTPAQRGNGAAAGCANGSPAGAATPAEAWAPEVVGRRIVAWLSHASLILDGAERRPYRAILLSLEDQVTYLSASWRNAPHGQPRLQALIGLTQAALCIAGHERRLAAVEPHLADEIERQFLADGGHISRNPSVAGGAAARPAAAQAMLHRLRPDAARRR